MVALRPPNARTPNRRATTPSTRLPENPISQSSPGAIDGLDLRHPLLSKLLRDVAVGRISEVAAVLLPFAKVRLQGLAHTGIQRRPELLTDGRLVQRRGLSETARQKQSDPPVMQAAEQLGVA